MLSRKTFSTRRWLRLGLCFASTAVLFSCHSWDDPEPVAEAPVVIDEPQAKPLVSVSAQKFVNAAGEEILLNGINYGQKGTDPANGWERSNAEAELTQIKQWGFNTLRLYFNWSMIEPAPGEYNETVLANLKQVADLARSTDLYVILDMHQDLYSLNDANGMPMGAGGAPDWAVVVDDAVEDFRLPPYLAPWSAAYFTSKKIQTAFASLYNNAEAEDGVGIRDRFAATWGMLAAQFNDNDHVIGFDLLNEPFPGTEVNEVMQEMVRIVTVPNPAFQGFSLLEYIDYQTMLMGGTPVLQNNGGNLFMDLDGDTVYETPFSMLNQGFQAMVALQMTHGAATALQDTTPYEFFLTMGNQLMKPIYQQQLMPFYQQVAGAIRSQAANKILFIEPYMISNFGVRDALTPLLDASGQTDANQAYAPHAYDDSPVIYEYIMNQLADRETELNMPLFIGEWGNLDNSDGIFGNDPMVFEAAALQAVTMREAMGASHAYWVYYPTLDEQGFFDKFLQRPYPSMVAGNLSGYGLDESNTFEVSWEQLTSGDTVIFIPASRYPDGFTAEMADGGSVGELELIDGSENGYITIPSYSGATERLLTITAN